MLTWSYHKRLSRDIERWTGKGWLLPEGRAAILDELRQQRSGSRLPAIIGILGAVLLATGAMTFMSANWQEMSKLTRLIILFSAMWAAFGAAVWLQRTAHDYLLEAMLLLGAGMFGVNIMLIAQIYHIDGHYPDALFLWTVGALVVALALESRAALALAFVLMTIWTGAEMMSFDVRLHWPFVPVWVVGAAVIFRMKWRAGLHLATLSLGFWGAVTMLQLANRFNWTDGQTLALMALLTLPFFMLGLIRDAGKGWLMGFEPALMRYAMLGLLTASFLMQIDLRGSVRLDAVLFSLMLAVAALSAYGALSAYRSGALKAMDMAVLLGFAAWLILFHYVPRGLVLWVHAPIYMGFAIWLMAFAQYWAFSVLLPMALTAFGAEVLYIYAETMGSLLDTSLFFLVGGVLLIALAFGLEKLRRALSAPRSGEEGAS